MLISSYAGGDTRSLSIRAAPSLVIDAADSSELSSTVGSGRLEEEEVDLWLSIVSLGETDEGVKRRAREAGGCAGASGGSVDDSVLKASPSKVTASWVGAAC
jgi:hypothetical protein